jgi:adenine-specific DNA-methyltransferase
MTPIAIINHMIDDILNLSENQLKTYTFLENSCGDGAFIQALLDRGVPAENIFACDVDEDICQTVQKMLPTGHFRLGSFFAQKDWEKKFDVVIGNPPFVRIHNIPEDTKNEIQSFDFCFGMYDLYYAFYEYGLKMLKPNGILLYISPNSFTKNASGIKLREYIENNNLLAYFEDFSDEQKFEGYSTYTCIMMLTNSRQTIEIPWNKPREKVGLSYTSLQNGLATLADRIFIQDKFDGLEKECVRPIIKASTGEIKECIYPPSTEEELKKYPKTYEYLLSHKKELENRSITGSTKWFQFGRSQGLSNINNEKLVISTTMPNSEFKYTRVGPEYLVYSGLYATAEDLDKLEEEFQSNNLLDYLVENGKPMRGGYTQITSTLLKNY